MPRTKAGDGNAEFIRFALAGIDAEIKELQEKRAELLKRTSPVVAQAPAAAAPAAKKRRGRKPGSKKAAKKAAKKMVKTAAKKVTKKSAKKGAQKVAKATRAKREVSPETRERLSAAAKARWANARAAQAG